MSRTIDDQRIAAGISVILNELMPRLDEAAKLGVERYPDDDAALNAWVHGAIYGAASSYLHDHAGEGTEVTPDFVATVFVSLAEMLEEIFNEANDGDFDRAIERLVPDVFAVEG